MFPLMLVVTLLLASSPCFSIHTEHVEITAGHVVQEIGDMFVGVTIDSHHLRYHPIDELRSNKLLTYVQALKPAYVRVGGTQEDFITFDLHATKSHTTHVNGIPHYTLPVSVWDELNAFVRKSGLKLIYGLNDLERKNGKWDPTNSVALLKYSAQKGYQIAGIELGNEPNHYDRLFNETISATEVGADFQELTSVLKSSAFRDSLVLGPDIAGYKDKYIDDYYMNGATAKVSDFTDSQRLDRLRSNDIEPTMKVASRHHPTKAVWLGETSSAYGGGAVNISDRYVAGFMWLDKLGLSARYGLKGAMRQTLYDGNNGLLNNIMDPNPDYWLTVLYKKLVGNKVFDVKTLSDDIRVYAHCTKQNIHGNTEKLSPSVICSIPDDVAEQYSSCYKVVWVPFPSFSVHTEHVAITTGHVVQEINDMFIGVTIDSTAFKYTDRVAHLRSSKLVNYVKPLIPAYVRVGGTNGDFITFDMHVTRKETTHVNGIPHYKLPISIWDDLNAFIHKSGLKLVYGLNNQERKNGKWDPTNSKTLINYSSQKGYHIAGFELGNEPNRYYLHSLYNVTSTQLGGDFQELTQVLHSTSYKDSLILGPDIAGYKYKYIDDFLSHGGLAIDVITIHHYYMDGNKATVADFSDASKLDRLRTNEIVPTLNVANKHHPAKALWLGETSSAYGGGADGTSDRYLAGFMWLDKLGQCARYGVKGVMRQTLFGGHYGLLNSNLDPNPDYWLTVLYKGLVGNKVFDVKTSSRNIRVYAHCTKRNNQFHYAPGSLTVYALNLNTNSIVLQFPSLHGQNHYDVFWLKPEKGDLKATRVQLNGKILEYSNGKLPSLSPSTVTSGSVTAPGKTFGFIVIPGADIAACKTPDHGGIIG